MLGMGMHRLMTIFMFFATISIMAISLSYPTQEAFATVDGGFSDKGFSIISPPDEVGNDDQQMDTVFAFDEKQNLVLLADTPVDLLATTNAPGVIPEGVSVSSTTVIYDPEPTAGVVGCVDFKELVLGIQFVRETLIVQDDILGADGTFYDNTVFRGIEPFPHGNDDIVWFSAPNSVCFDLVASTPGDTFRVITEGGHNTTVLWQVGVFDQGFLDMSQGGFYTGPYDASTVPANDCGGIPSFDCVDPDFPGILGNGPHNSGVSWTDEVTIEFDAPLCNEAMLIYSRAGIENDDVFFDGEYLETVNSAEGVYKKFNFHLGPLTEGLHSVTIEYEGDQGFTPEIITFEDGPPTELDNVGTVSTPTADVTFKIDDGSNANLTLLPEGVIIERGDPRYGFGSPAGGDQVAGMIGDFSLSNNIDKTTHVPDWDAFDYVILFDTAVDNLRLDVYDFGDFNPVLGDEITLKVYSDITANTEVGSHTILATAAGDNLIITLSVPNPSDTIRSARVIDSQGDIGTAIDNVEFNFNPEPSPDSPDDLHAVDALALVCWEDAVPPQVICEPDTMDLIAGQTIVAGVVTIINDGTTLFVTIETQDGWSLTESHLDFGDLIDGFPTNKKGNPKVGHFDFQESHALVTTEFTYEFLLADLGIDLLAEEPIPIAIHTVVVKVEADEIVAEETAWKQGERFVEKGNWAMHSTYDIQDCDEIE